MSESGNQLQQLTGPLVPDWSRRSLPSHDAMTGRFCRMERLDADRHAADLFAANDLDQAGAGWTYLSGEQIRDAADYRRWVEAVAAGCDPLYYAIIDLTTGKAVGVATYMRLNPEHGVIEVGSIHYSPLLQRKPAATEAMFLMMAHIFDDLGYRRYEWKCDALNAPSRAAALRLGFTFEGIFRQAIVYKGRNRDTAWYSVIDSEWPALKLGYEAWLNSENFDTDGKQRQKLGDLLKSVRSAVR